MVAAQNVSHQPHVLKALAASTMLPRANAPANVVNFLICSNYALDFSVGGLRRLSLSEVAPRKTGRHRGPSSLEAESLAAIPCVVVAGCAVFVPDVLCYLLDDARHFDLDMEARLPID
jgi:hypothetical protein